MNNYAQEVLKKVHELMPEYLPSNMKSYTVTGNTTEVTYYCSECEESFGKPMPKCPKCSVELDSPGNDFKKYPLDKTKKIPITCITKKEGENLFFEIVLTGYQKSGLSTSLKWKRRITAPIIGCIQQDGNIKMYSCINKKKDISTILKRAERQLNYLEILYLSDLKPLIRAENQTENMWKQIRQSKLFDEIVCNLRKCLFNPSNSDWGRISLSSEQEYESQYTDKILEKLEKFNERKNKKKESRSTLQQEELFNYKKNFRPAFAEDLKSAIDKIAYMVVTPVLESRSEIVKRISCSCGYTEQISAKLPTDEHALAERETFKNLIFEKTHKCPSCGRNQYDQMIEGRRFRFTDREISNPARNGKTFNVVWLEKTGLPDDSILIRIYSFKPDGQRTKMESLSENHRIFFSKKETLAFRNEYTGWQKISITDAKIDLDSYFSKSAIWPQTEKQISDVLATEIGRSPMFSAWNFKENELWAHHTPGNLTFSVTYTSFPGIAFLQEEHVDSVVDKLCQTSFSQITRIFNVKGKTPEEAFGVSRHFLRQIAKFDSKRSSIGLDNFVNLIKTTEGKEEEIMAGIWAVKNNCITLTLNLKEMGYPLNSVVDAAKQEAAKTMKHPAQIMKEIKEYAMQACCLGLNKDRPELPETFSQDARFMDLMRSLCAQRTSQKPYSEALPEKILNGPGKGLKMLFCTSGKDKEFLRTLFFNRNLQSVREAVLFCGNGWNYMIGDDCLETSSALSYSENMNFPFVIVTLPHCKWGLLSQGKNFSCFRETAHFPTHQSRMVNTSYISPQA